jgi:pectinesterase
MDAHQFAFRSFPSSTRIILENCTFISDGGDTVSPWNVENGLYYLKNCFIKGHVDAWCPRGTAFAENCTFYALNSSAFVWHDSSANENDKTVMKNCTFDGIKDFPLGRYHKNSNFYFFDCKFSENMADMPLYYAQKDKNIPVKHRSFYKNCSKKGKQFVWYQDNTKISSQKVNFKWVFGKKWNVAL